MTPKQWTLVMEALDGHRSTTDGSCRDELSEAVGALRELAGLVDSDEKAYRYYLLTVAGHEAPGGAVGSDTGTECLAAIAIARADRGFRIRTRDELLAAVQEKVTPPAKGDA